MKRLPEIPLQRAKGASGVYGVEVRDKIVWTSAKPPAPPTPDGAGGPLANIGNRLNRIGGSLSAIGGALTAVGDELSGVGDDLADLDPYAIGADPYES